MARFQTWQLFCYICLLFIIVHADQVRGTGKLSNEQPVEEETVEKPPTRPSDQIWKPWEIAILIVGVLVAVMLLSCIIYQVYTIRRNKGPVVLKIKSRDDKEKSPSNDKKGYTRAPMAEPDPNGVNGEKKKSPAATPSPTKEEEQAPPETPASDKDEKAASHPPSPDIKTSDKARLIEEKVEGNNEQKPPTYFEVSNGEEEKPKEEV